MIVLLTDCTANPIIINHHIFICQSNAKRASKIERNSPFRIVSYIWTTDVSEHEHFHVILIISDVENENEKRLTIFGIRRSIFNSL